jgi:hypothetical protein
MLQRFISYLFTTGRKARLNRIPPLVYAVLLVLIGIIALYLFNEYRQTKSELSQLQSGSSVVSSEEIEKIITEVEKLTVIPEGEEPTVATVSDANLLKDKPFFANAQNGDKVLIFNKAKQAIIYRPSVRKVIAVGPITVQSNTTEQPQVPRITATPPPTYVAYPTFTPVPSPTTQ